MYETGNKSYVVRTTRMSPSQKRAYIELAPLYRIDTDGELVPERIFPHRLAEGNRPFILEPGFGMGYALAETAERHPECDFLGVEVHKPGIGKIMSEIKQRDLRNLRVIESDAVSVYARLQPRAVSGFHLFFPDPWPKKRHHKRRMVRTGFPELIYPILADRGYVYIVTDWDHYAEQIRMVFAESSHFFGPVPPDRIGDRTSIARSGTAFERKGIAKGHTIHELFFTVESSP